MNHWEQLKNGVPLFDNFGKVHGFENKLLWDSNNDCFVLDIDAVRNELNVDLELVKGTKENAVAFLREISQIVHEYIHRKKPAILREKSEYFLKYDMRNRKIIYRCLVDMVRFALYSGGNITGYQPAINFNETSVADIEKVRDERVLSFVMDSIIKTNRLMDRNFIEYFTLPEEW